MRDEDLASEQPKKSKRRNVTIRFERPTYANSKCGIQDYKQLDDGRWFLCYEDDASRFVTGYGWCLRRHVRPGGVAIGPRQCWRAIGPASPPR